MNISKPILILMSSQQSFRNITKFSGIGIFKNLSNKINESCIHTKAGWPCWKMKKDVRIRKTIKEYAFERLNLNMMRKNNILPKELREICDREIAELPTDSSITRAHCRCMLTSRARGLVPRYGLSRMVWRHNADYNKLYGFTRALW